MVSRKVMLVICMVVTTLCLVSGYLVAGQWIWVVIGILTSLIWLPAQKNPNSWLPSICLFANVCLAVIGLLAGSPPALMFCAAGFALATWDLIFLDSELQNNASSEQTRGYENTHMRSLGLALGFGLLLTFLGRLLELQIPFVMLLLSIGLLIFGLDYVWSFIKKRRTRISVPGEKN